MPPPILSLERGLAGSAMVAATTVASPVQSQVLHVGFMATTQRTWKERQAVRFDTSSSRAFAVSDPRDGAHLPIALQRVALHPALQRVALHPRVAGAGARLAVRLGRVRQLRAVWVSTSPHFGQV